MKNLPRSVTRWKIALLIIILFITLYCIGIAIMSIMVDAVVTDALNGVAYQDKHKNLISEEDYRLLSYEEPEEAGYCDNTLECVHTFPLVFPFIGGSVRYSFIVMDKENGQPYYGPDAIIRFKSGLWSIYDVDCI